MIFNKQGTFNVHFVLGGKFWKIMKMWKEEEKKEFWDLLTIDDNKNIVWCQTYKNTFVFDTQRLQ